MNKTLNVRIQNAYKTEAEWNTQNPVAKEGEIMFSSDKRMFKVGDGVSNWKTLTYNSSLTLNGLTASVAELNYVKGVTESIQPQLSKIPQIETELAKKVEQTDITEAINAIEIGGRNLLQQYIRAGRQCTKIDNKTVKVGTGVADTYFYIKAHCALKKGETYTLSCEASNVPSGCNWSFGVNGQNSVNRLHINRNGKCYVVCVWNADVNAGAEITIDDFTGRPTTAPNIILTNFKLEKGTKATDWTPAPEDITPSYIGALPVDGTAVSAEKLTSSAGSATQPIYFSGGKPVATTYALHKTVPADAKFTDTTYTSLKNPYALTLQFNGSTNQTYDGSAAKTFNVTPAAIGALKKTGDVLTIASNQYEGNYGINMSNSDIIGINAMWTSDLAENCNEGLNFYRTNGNYDAVWSKDGIFYYTPNHARGSTATDYTVLHSGNYNDYSPTKTGTGASGTWGINISGYTTVVRVSDTRNDNPAPNSPDFDKCRVTYDFKKISTIGSPTGFSGTYCGLMSFAPWSETSGGYGYQEAYGYSSSGTPRLVIRCADLSATSWGSWYKIYTSADKPTLADIGAAAASHTHPIGNIVNLQTTIDSMNTSINGSIKGISISGTTITYTKNNNTTGKIYTQDSNVSQTPTSSSSWHPLVIGFESSSSEIFDLGSTGTTAGVHVSSSVIVQPSTGTIKASTFKGALSGNATTATTTSKVKDYNDTNGNIIEIGYAGSSATVDSATHAAVYMGRKIKDMTFNDFKAKLGSLKNPYSLTINTIALGGGASGIMYDGSSAMTLDLNFNHTHSGLFNVKYFGSNYQTAFRTTFQGHSGHGDFLSIIRPSETGMMNAPSYSSGVTWGVGDTQGYLITAYYDPVVYIGGGNSDKLNWVKQISFTDHTHNYAGSSSVGGAANSATLINPNKGVSTVSTSVSGWNGALPSGHKIIWAQSFVDSALGTDTGDIGISLSGSTTANIFIDGNYYSMGNIVLNAGNYSSYALPLSGGTVSGQFAATRIGSGYMPTVDNSIGCSNWFRSSGDTGWFNQTYGGGIYMTDSTYVRIYNNKKLSVNNGVDIAGTADQLRLVCGNYGWIVRNDSESLYLLVTAANNQWGSWANIFPFRIQNSNGFVTMNAIAIPPASEAIAIRPTSDNTKRCGNSANRFSYIHAASGTIQTSDEREKNILGNLSAYEKLFMKLSPIAYRWKDNDDKRIRFGLGAQTTEREMIACGLNVSDYSMIDHDYFDEPVSGLMDRYGMNYQELDILTMHMTQQCVRKVVEHEDRLTKAEQRAESLQYQLNQAFERIAEQDKQIKQLQSVA